MNNQANFLATLWPWVTGQAFRLPRWLYAQVLPSTVRPSVRFDLATAHLVIQRIVLPGVPGLPAYLRGSASARAVTCTANFAAG
jgi:hypothetical protein